MARLLDLPPDALCAVAGHLSFRDLRALLLTSRLLFAHAPALWAAAGAALPHRPPRTRAAAPHAAVRLAHAATALFCAAPAAASRRSPAAGSASAATACARTGRLALAGAGGVRVWGPGAWASEAAWAHVAAGGAAVGAACWDAEGARLAVASGKAVVVYGVGGGGRLEAGRPLRGHGGDVTCLAFAGVGGDVLASGAQDAALRLTHARTRRGLGVLRGHAGPLSALAALGSGGERLLSVGPPAEARVKLWDVEAQVCTSTVRLSSGAVRDVVADAARDTAYVAAGASVRVLDLRAGGATAAVLSLPRAWRSDAAAAVLALRDDGLVAAGVGGGGVAVWDPRGPWEARGLGWPGRGGHRESRSVRSLVVTEEAAIVGTGDGRVAALALDGSAAHAVAFACAGEKGGEAARAAVQSMALDRRREGLLAVCRADGSMDVLDMCARSTAIDWEKAEVACGVAHGSSRFWAE